MSAKKKPRKHVEKKPTHDVFLEPELTWANVNLQDCDAVNQMTEQQARRAGQRIHEAVKDLQEHGIIDEHGKSLKTDPPPDMRPGSKTTLPE
jgi:hypothetical protein